MAKRDDGGEIETIDGAGRRFLVIEAPYYAEVAAQLLEGTTAEFKISGAEFDRVSVPGALEIPQALGRAVAAGLMPGGARKKYDGVVALGCVIRGETSHYDIVCNHANHWLMDLCMRYDIPLGNAILTVDTHEQALTRASGGRRGKGGDAARACLSLVRLADEFTKGD